MLIESTLPDSLSTTLSIAKQENMDSSYDWPHFTKTWQLCSSCEECPSESCRECLDHRTEENQLLKCKVLELSTCSDISSPLPKRDGFVYKRRKLQYNGVALLSEENTDGFSKESGAYYSRITSKDQNSAVKANNDKDGCSAVEGKCGKNERYLSPKDNTNVSSCNNGVKDTGECSSSGNAIANLVLDELISERELCISVLKNHGLLGGVCERKELASLEFLGSDDPNSFLKCKTCGHSENPLKMLICDLCEEAFHVTCCSPRVKKLRNVEWYCQPCSRSKETVSSCITGTTSEEEKNVSYGDLGPLLAMLRDSRPHISRVRIGKAFQVEVPAWSGPIADDSDSVLEFSLLDSPECASLDCWNNYKPQKTTSIGNWIQCRDVLYTSDSNEGTICGKWRRAPLFVVQTDEWDCSCALPWDPFHADCAVPQEVETEVVLKHLKYIEMLRPRLANTKQNSQARSNSSEQNRKFIIMMEGGHQP
uniref:Uncharacterized protein n=1 Tax=Ananas comosus var. bracteatus TaxID=296719 RepID=A0A6V7PAB9_ANACO|nr:unnamed protein product [Ananas comosus var. bracteatus]